jgi:hypothetical protein
MPFNQQELLEWMSEHPILTVVVLLVVFGGLADILRALLGH